MGKPIVSFDNFNEEDVSNVKKEIVEFNDFFNETLLDEDDSLVKVISLIKKIRLQNI